MSATLREKLKLAALARTSPASVLSSRPVSSIRRTFMSTSGAPQYRESDGLGNSSLDEVISRLVFQAGVDYEVVMCASAFPDPKVISYDTLLAKILSYLDLFVEADYTVVFFAAGGKHTPSFEWIWKAYRSLRRKYRKNLKRLIIVHSSWFSKMLFSVAGTAISPKFFAKVLYVKTLSQLAHEVPLTQIDIPPIVYQENLKHENQVTLPNVQQRSTVFGAPLEDLMGLEGEKGGIPRVVKDCLQYIRDHGLREEGIFRRSPNSTMLRQVQAAYDRGQVVDLKKFGDPHLAAVLVKKYIRDLAEPIFPEAIYETILQTPPFTDDPADFAAIDYIRGTIFTALPGCTYILLSSILHLLHEISCNASVNLMDAHNLAIVLTPNLVSSSNPARDVMICTVGTVQGSHPALPGVSTERKGRTTLGSIVKLCVERYYEVFDEVIDRTEPVYSSVHDDREKATPNFVSPNTSSQMQSSNSHTSMSSSSSSRLAADRQSFRISRSGSSATESLGSPFGTVSKARSLLSAMAEGSRSSNSTFGRRTTLPKSSGSAVEAVGLTIGGTFDTHSMQNNPQTRRETVARKSVRDIARELSEVQE